RCGGRYGDVVQWIGHTPLVELKRLKPKPEVRIWAKLESRNPTGSVKDRVARSMIEGAEENGLIRPGQTILEPTSGNTGISLAMICGRKGYPLKAVMPDNVTRERTELLRMYGAEIVYSEGSKGSNGAVELALEMAEKDASYYMPYQYGNRANPDAHYNGTALEILEELDEVSAFVAGLGTAGSPSHPRSTPVPSTRSRTWTPPSGGSRVLVPNTGEQSRRELLRAGSAAGLGTLGLIRIGPGLAFGGLGVGGLGLAGCG